MSKKKNKQAQVAKVSAETHVDAKDLQRLPQDALQKLDDMTPDDGDLLGGDSQELPTLPDGESGPVVDGPAMPDLQGTLVVGEVAQDGVHTTPQETPQTSPQVETEEGQGSTKPDVLPGKGADAVVKPDQVARAEGTDVPWKGPETEVKDTTVIGFHPITGKPVRVCDQ